MAEMPQLEVEMLIRWGDERRAHEQTRRWFAGTTFLLVVTWICIGYAWLLP